VIRFDQIEHASLTDVGVRRSHNQDNHAVQLARDEEQWRQRGHLFLVADGMGAHAVGEKASEQAAALVPHTYLKHAQQGPAPALRKAFVEANASIHACGQANREFAGMGTTATALLLRPEGAWVGHVGDSRAYRVRDGVIEQLSYDHSLVWEYARIKQIDPDEVEDIPANVIHRCLGPEPLVQVDVEGPHPLRPGDIFVLCSDGLSGPVTDHEIGAVVSVLPPAEACRFLVDLANLRGGPDNITVLVIRVGTWRADANGIPSSDRREGRPAHRPWLSRGIRWIGIPHAHVSRRGTALPWWVGLLALGSLLALGATLLEFHELSGPAVLAFVLAAVAILAGLGGLAAHFYQEQKRRDSQEDLPPPRIHRRTSCVIDAPLLDRLGRALEAIRQRAQEKQWDPDWPAYQEHHQAGASFLETGDVSSAFREFCRALLPLTQALSRQRNKEESFQPIWDKTR
jgi:serine/threonine protein phosphatase PrpC